MSGKRRWLIGVAVGATVFAVIAGTALGSPGSGFDAKTLGHRATLANPLHTNMDRIKFQTKEPVDFQVQEVTYHPKGFSGWHYHPGFVLVVVESGHVTLHDANCRTKTYGPHESFVETGHDPLMLSNESETEDAVVYGTFVAPQGSPFRIETDPPACAA